MGLVDYSESSGSEDEAPVKAPVAKPASTSKKPFQKVVDRSNPGKIVVNLPSTQPENPRASSGDEPPPAKRARTGGKGGLFSGLNSFLPPPKNAAKAAAPSTSSSSSSRPVFQLKTGAEPGFSRDRGDGGEGAGDGGLSLPPPKAAPQPTIPEGMKPADEVKLVGKPMMFRPLSVARKPKKKAPAAVAPKTEPAKPQAPETKEAPAAPAPSPAPKKVSLFSIEPEEETSSAAGPKTSGAYEPLFETDQTPDATNGYYADHGGAAHAHYPAPTTAPADANSLDTIANDLNLSAAARRELFGRGGGPQTASRVINFNTDEEYKHNEELRASGQQQTHTPVRSIAPGKHSLRQLVNQVQNQREALEESFAQGKNKRKEASNRYGW